MSPSPSFFHQTIIQNLSDLLSPHVRDRGLGKVRLAPLDFYLDDHNVYQPNLIFISSARASIIQPDGVPARRTWWRKFLLPRTARYDLNAKRAGYARSGVRELWLVYPEAKRIELFQLQENAESPAASYPLGNERFFSSLFPGLEIRAEQTFAE